MPSPQIPLLRKLTYLNPTLLLSFVLLSHGCIDDSVIERTQELEAGEMNAGTSALDVAGETPFSNKAGQKHSHKRRARACAFAAQGCSRSDVNNEKGFSCER